MPLVQRAPLDGGFGGARNAEPGMLADRVGASFGRFWNEAAGHCFDVLDGPDGHEAALRPNQILAVSLPASPLPSAQQRKVVRPAPGTS